MNTISDFIFTKTIITIMKNIILIFFILSFLNINEISGQVSCPAPDPKIDLAYFPPYTTETLKDFMNLTYKPNYDDSLGVNLNLFQWGQIPVTEREVFQYFIDAAHKMHYNWGVVIPADPTGTVDFLSACKAQCNVDEGGVSHDCGNNPIFHQYCSSVGNGVPTFSFCDSGPCWASPTEIAGSYYESLTPIEAALEMCGNMMADDGAAAGWSHRDKLLQCSYTDYIGVGYATSPSLSVMTVQFANISPGAGCTTPPTSCGSTIPIKLIDFRATTHSCNIELNWQTASEVNNDGFEIQTSQDGETWQSLGWVDGNLNTNMISKYEFTTDKILSGINYFRLKQVDLDGKYEYSWIISENMNCLDSINLYPNPTTTSINISGVKPETNYRIYNILGIEVQNGRISKSSIDVSTLPESMYYLKINNQSLRFVKSR